MPDSAADARAQQLRDAAALLRGAVTRAKQAMAHADLDYLARPGWDGDALETAEWMERKASELEEEATGDPEEFGEPLNVPGLLLPWRRTSVEGINERMGWGS